MFCPQQSSRVKELSCRAHVVAKKLNLKSTSSGDTVFFQTKLLADSLYQLDCCSCVTSAWDWQFYWNSRQTWMVSILWIRS